MKAELILRFTQDAEAEVPDGISLQAHHPTDLMPSVGDDYALAGTNETKVFRVIRRQVEYRSETTLVTLVLDTSPETYIPTE